MDFVMELFILVNWKDKNYNWILIIIDYLTKLVNYKLVKVTIDISDLIEDIISIIIYCYGIFKLIIINQGLFFLLKF